MPVLIGLSILLLLQAAGELIAHRLQLPFPGPVIGMLLLLAVMPIPALRAPVAAAATVLLQHLSLLFIPVGVGVITHLDLIASHGVGLVVVIVVSTWIGLGVTALVLRAGMRRFRERERKGEAA